MNDNLRIPFDPPTAQPEGDLLHGAVYGNKFFKNGADLYRVSKGMYP